jgi:hypothetical protein
MPKVPPIAFTPTAPVGLYGPVSILPKPDIPIPYMTATTLPPTAAYSNRYIDPYPMEIPTSSAAIIPAGPSRLVDTHFNTSADNGLGARYTGGSFIPDYQNSLIDERAMPAGHSSIKDRNSNIVSSSYWRENPTHLPYGRQTMSAIGGSNGSVLTYQNVPSYTPRDMTPQTSHNEHTRPNYAFLSTESGAQSKIRSNQLSDDFIKHL